MIWILLVFLFIMQIIGFYFLALLNTKVSKFDDLEKKQRKLMVEMDNSIGAYLSELKDENERLIERLAGRAREPVAKKMDSESTRGFAAESVEKQPVMRVSKPTMPVNLALKSYNAVAKAQEQQLEKLEMPEIVDDIRTQVIKLHDTGQSVEEIAKKLGKGRTEVELILKFR